MVFLTAYGLGGLLTVGLFGLFVGYRDTPVVRTALPQFLVLILFGLLTGYGTVRARAPSPRR